METGIPVREWTDGDPADLSTALRILEEQQEQARKG